MVLHLDTSPGARATPSADHADPGALVKALMDAQRANRMESRRRDDRDDAELAAAFLPSDA